VPKCQNDKVATNGSDDMVHCFSREVVDDSFTSRLNANLDLFVVDNGVFGMSNGGAFRAITPDGFKSLTAGWKYDPDLAKEYRYI
jgi:hypothetical protein